MKRLTGGLLSRLLVVLVAALILTVSAFSAPVLLWDATDDSNVAGYKVYSGSQSHVYSQVIDVGLRTSNTLSNLKQGLTCYYAVTAYTAGGLESPFSEEISYTAPVDGLISAALQTTFASTNKAGSISFTARAGQQCRVVSSTNLLAWHEVYFIVVSTNGSIRYIDVSATNKPMSFYRVIATPP